MDILIHPFIVGVISEKTFDPTQERYQIINLFNEFTSRKSFQPSRYGRPRGLQLVIIDVPPIFVKFSIIVGLR